MKLRNNGAKGMYLSALLGLSAVSAGYLLVGAMQGGGFGDWYLLWNLFLAWIPLVLAFLLVRVVATGSWSSWAAIGLSIAWLLFLPNSFYIVSDLIHLQDMPRTHILFDSLMFSMFTLTGLALGYSSLYMVHTQLRRRLPALHAGLFISFLLFLCSFAIYLGRDLRWNSWDVLLSPAGILFDISERVIDPLAYPQVFSVTLMFTIFLNSLYWALWLMLRAVGLTKSATIKTGSGKS